MTNRTLVGDFGGGDYRIRMSKPGFDVTAALDPERLAFDSAWKDGGIVYRTGTVAVPGGPFQEAAYSFGETLPSIPFVYPWRILSGTELQQGAKGTNLQTYRTWHCIASTTGLIFSGQPDTSSDGAYTIGFLVIRSLENG